MTTERPDRPPLVGHGFVDVPTLALHTGLGEATLRALIEDDRIEGGLVDEAGRGVGVLDEGLPTTADLLALGLSARADYDPDQLRGTDEEIDDGPGDVGPGEDAGPDGSISW